MAKTKKSETRSDYTKSVTVRLTEDEYDAIQKLVEKYGFTVSQTIRYVIFKKKVTPVNPQNITEKGIAYQKLTTLSALVSAVKSLARQFSEYTTAYERALMLLDENGKPIVTTKLTMEMMESMQDSLMRIQKFLSEVSVANGGQEIHFLAKNPVITRGAEAARKASDEEKNSIKYNYMQKITVCGNISREPEVFTSKNVEMMRFSVACEDLVGGEKTSTSYNIITRKTGVVDYLKKGRQVMVVGDLKVRMSKDDKNAQDVTLSVYCDDLVLGRV